MIVETLVLNRDERMLKILRHFVYLLIYTVGTRSDKTFYLSLVIIGVYHGGKAFWLHISRGHVRGIV